MINASKLELTILAILIIYKRCIKQLNYSWTRIIPEGFKSYLFGICVNSINIVYKCCRSFLRVLVEYDCVSTALSFNLGFREIKLLEDIELKLHGKRIKVIGSLETITIFYKVHIKFER